MIKERFASTGMVSRAAFFRQMAIKGCHVNMDLTDINEMIRLLGNITNNINQLSKIAVETQSNYTAEIEELRQRYDSLWNTVNGILKGLAKI